jgi:hypothetical protein
MRQERGKCEERFGVDLAYLKRRGLLTPGRSTTLTPSRLRARPSAARGIGSPARPGAAVVSSIFSAGTMAADVAGISGTGPKANVDGRAPIAARVGFASVLVVRSAMMRCLISQSACAGARTEG